MLSACPRGCDMRERRCMWVLLFPNWAGDRDRFRLGQPGVCQRTSPHASYESTWLPLQQQCVQRCAYAVCMHAIHACGACSHTGPVLHRFNLLLVAIPAGCSNIQLNAAGCRNQIAAFALKRNNESIRRQTCGTLYATHDPEHSTPASQQHGIN